MKIKAVLWDMDGVIIASEQYYMAGTLDWMKQIGFEGDKKEICTIIGTTMAVTHVMLAKMLNNKYTVEEVESMNEKYFEDNPLNYADIMNDGIIDVLEYLKSNGIKIALCSSSPLKTIKDVVKVCNIESYFDYIVSGDQFTHSKPNPEIYLSAVSKLKVKIDECMVIEDSNMGIAAGKNANIYTVALKDQIFSIDQSNADIIINGLTEIIDIIKSSNY